MTALVIGRSSAIVLPVPEEATFVKKGSTLKVSINPSNKKIIYEVIDDD